MPPVVVVMGVSGCGKSTVGTLLAAELGVPFADADDLHSEPAKAKMAAGRPLDDADRAPWLDRCKGWLAEHPDGAVLACSALKRRYRDVLRTGAPKLWLLHLAGDPAVVSARVAHRTQHFLPASLVASQYQALEPLEPDEQGIELDLTEDPAQLVEQFLRAISDPDR